jgi:ABC-type nitrate/sulfonate/bicarbonate transport system permease component
MLSVTLALGVAGALGLAFESTRWLGVLCAALLGLLHPVPFLVLLPIAAGAFLFFQRRRSP